MPLKIDPCPLRGSTTHTRRHYPSLPFAECAIAVLPTSQRQLSRDAAPCPEVMLPLGHGEHLSLISFHSETFGDVKLIGVLEVVIIILDFGFGYKEVDPGRLESSPSTQDPRHELRLC